MAEIYTTTITANGSETIPLKNYRGARRIYSVFASGNFGGGTITSFLQADGTNNIAIKDSAGVAISFTDDETFNFESYSDSNQPVKLVVTLAGATSPSVNLRVCDNS